MSFSSAPSDNWQRVRRYLPYLTLAIIFIAALVLRLVGVGFGLPYSEEIDEPAIMDHAIKMVVTGDPNPHWFLYPTLYIYIQAIVAWAFAQWAIAQGTLKNVAELGTAVYDWRYLPQPELYLWARALTAVLGAGTILAMYFAGVRLYSRTIGILAALLLTFTHLHIQYSHYIRTDIPLTFFLTLSLFFAARLFRTGKNWDYIFAGIFFGLAVASKYTGALFAVTIIAAHLLRVASPPATETGTSRQFFRPERHLPLILGLGVSVLTFFLVTPFAITDWGLFWYGLGDDAKTYSFLSGTVENAGYYLAYFQQREGFGTLLTPIALIGLGIAVWRHKAIDLIAISFPILYFAFILVSERANIRTALPLTPFLGLFAALAIVEAAHWVSRHVPALGSREKWLIGGVMLLLLIAPVQKAIGFDRALLEPTLRMSATEWANANLPSGARVWSEPEAIFVNQAVMLPSADLEGQTLDSLLQQRVDYVVTADVMEPNAESTVDSALVPLQSYDPATPGTSPAIRIFQVPSSTVPVLVNGFHFAQKKYRTGDEIEFNIDWKILEPLGDDPAVSIELAAPDGQVSFDYQEPAERVKGRAKKWQAGSVVSDQYSFQLPEDLATNRYHIRAGFRNSRTAIPLQFGAKNAPAETVSLGSIIVAPESPANIGTPAVKMDQLFGQAIRLEGFTVPSCKLSSGTTIGLDLYWSTPKELEHNLTRFVHLIDGQGNLVAQQDIEPGEGAYPTSVWDTNMIFEDHVDLTIGTDTPAGTYNIVVGWYEFPSIEHLITQDGKDQLTLTSLSCDP